MMNSAKAMSSEDDSFHDPHQDQSSKSAVSKTQPLLLHLRIIGVVIVVLLVVMIIMLGKLISVQSDASSSTYSAEDLEKQLTNFEGFRVGWEHDHPKVTFPYPTVGVPVAGETFDFRQMAPDELWQYERQLAIILQPYNDTKCEYARKGAPNDGGYVVCSNYISKSEALINIGVEDRDGFGCDFTSVRGVPNYQYDCTSSKKPVCPQNGNRNYFYRSCVNDLTYSANKSFESLKDMIDHNGLKGKRISIKIDAQGAEMPALRTLPISYLDYIDHIVLEYHPMIIWYQTNENEISGFHHSRFKGNLQIFKTLGERFYPTNFHFTTNQCYKYIAPDLQDQHYFNSGTVELVLVNKAIMELNSNSRSFKTNHGLDRLNFDNKWDHNPDGTPKDCQFDEFVDPKTAKR